MQCFTVTADNASAILAAFKDNKVEPSSVNVEQSLNDNELKSSSSTDAATKSYSAVEIGIDDADDELLDIVEDDPAPAKLPVSEKEIQEVIVSSPELETAVESVLSDWCSETNLGHVLKRNSCLAHLLQLGIKDALKHDTVTPVTKRVQSIVAWFNGSNINTAQLAELCGIGIRTPCVTRWNSLYQCLQRLVSPSKVRPASSQPSASSESPQSQDLHQVT